MSEEITAPYRAFQPGKNVINRLRMRSWVTGIGVSKLARERIEAELSGVDRPEHPILAVSQRPEHLPPQVKYISIPTELYRQVPGVKQTWLRRAVDDPGPTCGDWPDDRLMAYAFGEYCTPARMVSIHAVTDLSEDDIRELVSKWATVYGIDEGAP